MPKVNNAQMSGSLECRFWAGVNTSAHSRYELMRRVQRDSGPRAEAACRGGAPQIGRPGKFTDCAPCVAGRRVRVG
jgi:hypothetical protein